MAYNTEQVSVGPENESQGSSAERKPSGIRDPECWVEEYGDYLYSFAMVRLRDPMQARDVVQETFLAALKSRSAYAGKSTERGWLVGILKHKIQDHYRKTARETLFADLEFFENQEDDMFVPEGLHKGAWVSELGPSRWGFHPAQNLDREEFWQAFRTCASKLPRRVSQVFLMRELDGTETKEICLLLNLSENNLWVMLHRARLALRRCLEKNWFAK